MIVPFSTAPAPGTAQVSPPQQQQCSCSLLQELAGAGACTLTQVL